MAGRGDDKKKVLELMSLNFNSSADIEKAKELISETLAAKEKKATTRKSKKRRLELMLESANEESNSASGSSKESAKYSLLKTNPITQALKRVRKEPLQSLSSSTPTTSLSTIGSNSFLTLATITSSSTPLRNIKLLVPASNSSTPSIQSPSVTSSPATQSSVVSNLSTPSIVSPQPVAVASLPALTRVRRGNRRSGSDKDSSEETTSLSEASEAESKTDDDLDAKSKTKSKTKGKADEKPPPSTPVDSDTESSSIADTSLKSVRQRNSKALEARAANASDTTKNLTAGRLKGRGRLSLPYTMPNTDRDASPVSDELATAPVGKPKLIRSRSLKLTKEVVEQSKNETPSVVGKKKQTKVDKAAVTPTSTAPRGRKLATKEAVTNKAKKVMSKAFIEEKINDEETTENLSKRNKIKANPEEKINDAETTETLSKRNKIVVKQVSKKNLDTTQVKKMKAANIKLKTFKVERKIPVKQQPVVSNIKAPKSRVVNAVTKQDKLEEAGQRRSRSSTPVSSRQSTPQRSLAESKVPKRGAASKGNSSTISGASSTSDTKEIKTDEPLPDEEQNKSTVDESNQSLLYETIEIEEGSPTSSKKTSVDEPETEESSASSKANTKRKKKHFKGLKYSFTAAAEKRKRMAKAREAKKLALAKESSTGAEESAMEAGRSETIAEESKDISIKVSHEVISENSESNLKVISCNPDDENKHTLVESTIQDVQSSKNEALVEINLENNNESSVDLKTNPGIEEDTANPKSTIVSPIKVATQMAGIVSPPKDVGKETEIVSPPKDVGKETEIIFPSKDAEKIMEIVSSSKDNNNINTSDEIVMPERELKESTPAEEIISSPNKAEDIISKECVEEQTFPCEDGNKSLLVVRDGSTIDASVAPDEPKPGTSKSNEHEILPPHDDQQPGTPSQNNAAPSAARNDQPDAALLQHRRNSEDARLTPIVQPSLDFLKSLSLIRTEDADSVREAAIKKSESRPKIDFHSLTVAYNKKKSKALKLKRTDLVKTDKKKNDGADNESLYVFVPSPPKSEPPLRLRASSAGPSFSDEPNPPPTYTRTTRRKAFPAGKRKLDSEPPSSSSRQPSIEKQNDNVSLSKKSKLSESEIISSTQKTIIDGISETKTAGETASISSQIEQNNMSAKSLQQVATLDNSESNNGVTVNTDSVTLADVSTDTSKEVNIPTNTFDAIGDTSSKLSAANASTDRQNKSTRSDSLLSSNASIATDDSIDNVYSFKDNDPMLQTANHLASHADVSDIDVSNANNKASDGSQQQITGNKVASSICESGVRKSRRIGKMQHGVGEASSLPHQPLTIICPTLSSQQDKENIDVEVLDSSLANSLCRCRERLNPLATVASDGPVPCQAVDHFDGRMLGCCNLVSNMSYLRVSGKIPFTILCSIHRQRLRRHNCCPGCGLFCSQGVFYECRASPLGIRHYFHKLCGLPTPDGVLVCPHCGSRDPPAEVHLEIRLRRKPIVYLEQCPEKKSVSGARITWTKDEYVLQPLSEGPMLELTGGKTITTSRLVPTLDKEKLQTAIASVSAGKPPNIKCTPKSLFYACKHGDLEKVLQILCGGVDPNARVKDANNQTSLHMAAQTGNVAIAHVLVMAGASLDLVDASLFTPLMLGIQKHHNSIVQYLVAAGAELQFKTNEGMTCLHLAAKLGNATACRHLLDSGRLSRHAINMQDEGGWTPLVWGSENKHINVVKFLLERGGNPQLCDVEQNTALHWAALSGCTRICLMLLDRGCSLLSMNAYGDTPLHIAARQNHRDAVVLLLARGASLDSLNSKGQTPLNCAVPDSEVFLQLTLNHELREVMVDKHHKINTVLSSDIAAGKEQVPIPCINAADDETLPRNYMYIAENTEADNVNINRSINYLKWCQCSDGCNSADCSCTQLNFRCWYDPDGRLLPDFNYADPPMIFECNRACGCNKLSCNNRVVQHGITAHLQLFRTTNKGWGVRALKRIQKGSYVCEYVGEIITDLEADQRQDDSYLFDLDNRDNETFCIDARNYGNVARFINHLCAPNLTPVKVFIDHQDLAFPRIALYASRDIEAEEELGFDYGEKFWMIKYKQFTCTCGGDSCKYSTSTIHGTLERYHERLRRLSPTNELLPPIAAAPPVLALPASSSSASSSAASSVCDGGS